MAATGPCPRCRTSLEDRLVEGTPALGCTACDGTWIAADPFKALVRRVASAARDGRPRRATLRDEPVRYLPCPACGGLMRRVQYGRVSGVIVDVCNAHGVWLDRGELEQVVAFVATGGLKVEAALDEALQPRKPLLPDRIGAVGPDVELALFIMDLPF